MKIFGKVVEILSEAHLLLELTEAVAAQEVLVVFAQIPASTLKEKYGVDHLVLPKGRVRVIAPQGNKLYLAEAVVSYQNVERSTLPWDRFQRAMALSGLLHTEVVKDASSTVLSAPTTPVEVKVNKIVSVGDPVGTE